MRTQKTGHVPTMTECSDAATSKVAKGCWQLPAARRERKKFLPRTPGGNTALRTLSV